MAVQAMPQLTGRGKCESRASTQAMVVLHIEQKLFAVASSGANREEDSRASYCLTASQSFLPSSCTRHTGHVTEDDRTQYCLAL